MTVVILGIIAHGSPVQERHGGAHTSAQSPQAPAVVVLHVEQGDGLDDRFPPDINQ